MNELASKMSTFWESVHTRGAHLGIDGEVPMMMERYARVTRGLYLSGRTVVDYGCGGGLLGLYLLEKRNIARYIGYDVAKRSLQYAAKNLSMFVNKELVRVEEHRWDFAAKEPHAIFCLACMIHFPTREYLDAFLAACDCSGAQYLVLEVRYAEQTLFQPVPYSSLKTATKACFTNEFYVSSRLSNYELKEQETDRSTRILRYEARR